MLAALMAATVIAAPHPAIATDGRTHLVYEVLLRSPAKIGGLVVRDPDRHLTLATLSRRQVAAARTAQVVFLDVVVKRVPAHLEHRIPSRHARPGFVTTARTCVEREAPVRVSPPLRGEGLLDVNGCCGLSDHVRALMSVDGRASNAQRFAIDFVRLNAAGDNTFTGDPARNESYAIYGADVLAGAPGTVVAVRNDLPENIPQHEPPPVLDTASGNRVVEDLGGGRFALYAHMQPGSVRVAVGRHVERGQVLGLVGNSGNSTEPHLHFHVMDGAGGASALGANGLPYAFDRFTLAGNIPDFTKPVLVPARHPRRRNQLPLQGDVVAF
jgi:hypothetical protein